MCSNRSIESKLVLIEETENENYNMVVNGVPMMEKGIGIKCPNCKRTLFFFPTQEKVEDALSLIYKQLDKSKDQLEKDLKYCGSCGEKLMFPSIVDGEVVKEEQA